MQIVGILLVLLLLLALIAIAVVIGAAVGFITGYAACLIFKVVSCGVVIAINSPFVYLSGIFSSKFPLNFPDSQINLNVSNLNPEKKTSIQGIADSSFANNTYFSESSNKLTLISAPQTDTNVWQCKICGESEINPHFFICPKCKTERDSNNSLGWKCGYCGKNNISTIKDYCPSCLKPRKKVKGRCSICNNKTALLGNYGTDDEPLCFNCNEEKKTHT